MASTDLEEQSVHVFIKKIKAITDKDKKQFISAFHSDSAPIKVKSAYDLAEKDQKGIRSAIADILGDEVKYEFKTDRKMISGIELAANGYKLSWSLAAYVNSLEKSVATTINKTHQAVK
ncbi:F0F1 ATP synthase subunit delta [Mucilaginibacter antarcticus]|uniref:F0F1 ATP synthase subunit delta n=1 Tax=Mucilaginibacter antarcticus TaxID=1855725 RepID=UPI003625FE54